MPIEYSIQPEYLTNFSPERTSSSLMSIFPSLRSMYRSLIMKPTRDRWELTHLVNVFFWTASLSSEIHKKHHKHCQMLPAVAQTLPCILCHNLVDPQQSSRYMIYNNSLGCYLEHSLRFEFPHLKNSQVSAWQMFKYLLLERRDFKLQPNPAV